MVWGIVLPSGFGDYCPLGDYVGWDERLEAYFRKETAETGQPFVIGPWLDSPAAYANHIIRKFRDEPGSKFSDLVPVGPPLPHEWPEEFRTKKAHDNLGALIQLNSGFLAVDERLKTLIEELEPGVHDFRPIRITMPRGKDYPVPYHVLLIRQFRASFRAELSADGAWYGKPGDYTVHDEKKAFAGSAMSSETIGGAHLWRERNLDRPKICLSDTLQGAIVKSGLRMMKHYKMKSV